jgi:iron complex transport system permease protein
MTKQTSTFVKTLTPGELAVKILICLAVLLLVMSCCVMIGSQPVSLKKAFAGFGGPENQNTDYNILFGVRLPRALLAALIGAALACCGGTLQAILRNPLADPYILGISSGAGLGAVIAILFGVSFSFFGGSSIGMAAFIGALATVWLVWLIGYTAGGRSAVTSLLLAGVVVNAFFSAVIMFLTSIAKAHEQRATVLWLMGNILEKDTFTLLISAGFILTGLAALFCIANKLNVLSFGEAEAKNLGVEANRTRIIAFGLSAFITAIAVSLSGLIGFVGLIVPHAIRLVFGPDHRQLLPLSAIIGAAFLVIADTIARTVVAPAQLPVGVITALAGGPFFLILLARYSRKVSWAK